MRHVSLQKRSAPISTALSESHGTVTMLSVAAHSCGLRGGEGTAGGAGGGDISMGATGGSGGPTKIRGPQSSQSVPA